MPRSHLAGLEAFLAIARNGSMRAAADALGIRPSAVSQQLKGLEQRLGVTLFTRTTRSIRLTDAGCHLLTRVEPAIQSLDDGVEEVQAFATEPAGRLRLTLSDVALRLIVEPILPAFHRTYPNILLDISVEDGLVDVVEGGFHAGIRPAHLLHDDMIAIPMTAPLEDAFFAAPSYLATYGRPQTPEDLGEHRCIAYRYVASGRVEHWMFRSGEGTVAMPVPASMIVDDTRLLIRSACAGLGIASFYRTAVQPLVAAGDLELLFEAHSLRHAPLHLYYPRAYKNMRRLRSFIDFLKTSRAGRPVDIAAKVAR
jgi:DNA-binding transcriptional LysR family regulator